MPPRSLRMARSHVSASFSGWSRSRVSNASFAVLELLIVASDAVGIDEGFVRIGCGGNWFSRLLRRCCRQGACRKHGEQ